MTKHAVSITFGDIDSKTDRITVEFLNFTATVFE